MLFVLHDKVSSVPTLIAYIQIFLRLVLVQELIQLDNLLRCSFLIPVLFFSLSKLSAPPLRNR